MRTRNPNMGRAQDTVLGRTSPGRSGSRGITVRDGVTEAHPVVDVTFRGGDLTDNGDGTVVVDLTQPSNIATEQGVAVTIYVATTGNDVTGDGTSGNKYASIGRALEDIPTVVTARYTIDVADGTYYELPYISRFVFPSFNEADVTTDARIVLDGNTTTPGNCIISGATSGAPTTPSRSFCIWVYRALVTIQGFKLQYASVRGLQASAYADIRLGAMAYDNCGDGIYLGHYARAVVFGNQTISNVANGIYLFEYSRLHTDGGTRTITMTGITNRGLYVVEAAVFVDPADTVSITAHSSGSRPAGIEGDGNAIIAIEGALTVSGAFVWSLASGAGSRIHIISTASISGASSGSYLTAQDGTIWDLTNSVVIDTGAQAPWALMPYFGGSAGIGVSVGSSNRAIYVPMQVLEKAVTLTGVYVNVEVQSGNISVGLFSSAGTRLATSGAVSCPAVGSPVAVSFTASVFVKPGRYYLAISADNTTATFTAALGDLTIPSPAWCRYQDTAHPVPSSASFTGTSGRQIVLVGLVSGGFPS